MTERIRKQVQDLTPHDFDAFAQWVYASDEEGDAGQDECTVRPLILGETASPEEQVIVQGVFFFPNGRVRFGMVTLNAGEDPSGHQPSLYLTSGPINFYCGSIEPGPKELALFTKALRSVAAEPYPIRYVSSLSGPNGRPLASGELRGMYWLADWRTGELRIAA